MAKSNLIRISLPDTTYDNTLKFAKHIDCVSNSGNPLASSAVKKIVRTVLNFYGDDKFQQCLEIEGIDALAYVQRCLNKGMRESLGEKK